MLTLCRVLAGKRGYYSLAWMIPFFVCMGYGAIVEAQVKSSDEDIRLETTLIQVPVIVKAADGRYITDLNMSDFIIYENGIKQEIALIKTVEEPFNVILLIDSSGSTSQQLDQIKSGAKQFIKQMRDMDKVMVISFNDSVNVLSEFTNNRELLVRAIDQIEPGEFTQVYEAVYTGVWEKLEHVEGRKAVIIFSDGIDTASSEIQREDTLDAVLESEDVIVYPIRYNTRPDVERKMKMKLDVRTPAVQMTRQTSGEVRRESISRELDILYSNADDYLNELAEITGGRIEKVDQLIDLGMAFSRIAEELRSQYMIAYYPISAKLPKRVLEVKINRPGCRVRVRPGFKVRTQ